MNSYDLFLQEGFAAVPPSAMDHLASDARDHCYATGDVRFCIAADCFDIISSCWGDDGAVRQAVVAKIEAVVVGELASAINHPDREAARSLALAAKATLVALVHDSGDLIYG